MPQTFAFGDAFSEEKLMADLKQRNWRTTDMPSAQQLFEKRDLKIKHAAIHIRGLSNARLTKSEIQFLDGLLQKGESRESKDVLDQSSVEMMVSRRPLGPEDKNEWLQFINKKLKGRWTRRGFSDDYISPLLASVIRLDLSEEEFNRDYS